MTQIALVTGGSRGIGAAVARELGRTGWQVAVNFNRSPDRADGVVADIVKAGGRAIAVQADVSDRDGVARMFAEVDRKLGRVGALVNNAGTNGKVMPFAELDVASLMEVYATNVFGSFYCAQEAARRMSTTSGGAGGTIVNISSVAARTGGMPGHVHYASSKGAVDVFNYALAKELGPQKIRVVAIRPGVTNTEIQQVFGGAEMFKRILPTIPIGRIGEPEDIAAAVAWALSPAAGYVTGTTIDVSGGR